MPRHDSALPLPPVALRIAVGLISLIAAACGGGSSSSSPTAPTTPSAPFTVTELRAGDGREAQNGNQVTIDYAVWLYDPSQANRHGRLVDTSLGGQPFVFVLGQNQVIRGMDMGVQGQKVGAVRELIIPPDLAYGAAGAGNGLVPPNATLIFEVELLNVQDP